MELSEYPKDKTIIDLFEEQVARTPQSIAVVFGEKQLTYAELSERSNKFAHYLKRVGVGEETLVPICLERSLEMIVGLLAILKAGGAYVPIDPDYPSERIGFMLEDIQAAIIITSKDTKSKLQVKKGLSIIDITDESLFSKYSTSDVQANVEPHNLAYVIYTSGSTGKPKGVMIEHHSLMNYLSWAKLTYSNGSSKRLSFGLFTSLSFDLTVTSIYLPLISGAELRIFGTTSDTSLLLKSYLESGASCIKITPAHISLLKDLKIKNISVEVAVVGGEQLENTHVKILRGLNPKIQIYNEYGPTESTVGCIVKEILSEEENILIGKPISNTLIYILNEEEQLQAEGVMGEIAIGGRGLARGYLNREGLTKEKFIKNPFEQGGRLYKTGDLGRWTEDGNLEFIGRKDDQVKIRGYRIELGEIESVLHQCELVSEAVVLAKEDNEGNKRLVAYIISKGLFDRKVVIDYLMNKLPEYMVPTLLVEMENFPLTLNGKIDKKGLPDPNRSNLLNNQYVAPRTKIEQKLAEMWQKLLNIEAVGIQDNFFEIGGNSLIAIRLMSKIEKSFKLKFPITILFRAPTIEELSYFISNKSSLQESVVVTVQPNGSRLPFFVVGDLMRSLRYYKLAKYLGEDYPVYEFRLPTTSKKEAKLNMPAQEDIEKTASFFIKELLRIQPSGPYYLGGTCGRGIVAYEMAQQLRAAGHEIGLLALFEVYTPEGTQTIPSYKFWKRKAGILKEQVRSAPYKDKFLILFKRAKVVTNMTLKIIGRGIDKVGYIISLKRTYTFKPYPGKITLFKAKKEYAVNFSTNDPYLGWKNYCAEENIELVEIPGGHGKILQEPGAKIVAEYIRPRVERITKREDENKKNGKYFKTADSKE